MNRALYLTHQQTNELRGDKKKNETDAPVSFFVMLAGLEPWNAQGAQADFGRLIQAIFGKKKRLHTGKRRANRLFFSYLSH